MTPSCPDCGKNTSDIHTCTPPEVWEKASTPPYGYCPKCGAPGKLRERRPNGNDTCQRGHSYPSKDALPSPPSDTEEVERKLREKLEGKLTPDGFYCVTPALMDEIIAMRVENTELKKAVEVARETIKMVNALWEHGLTPNNEAKAKIRETLSQLPPKAPNGN